MLQSDQPRLPTVLVIDDEPVILRSIRAALSANYNVLEADTALSAFDLSKTFTGPIDVVVADHALKDATGQEVVAKIKVGRPAVRVIYITSYGLDHASNQFRPVDAEILEKPFSPRDLRGAIFRALGQLAYWKAGGPGSAQKLQVDPIDLRNPQCLERLRDEVYRSRSLFGRLIAASALWRGAKSRYEHRLSSRYGAEDVDDALRLVHHEALMSWLSLSLRQQKTDVAIYLEGACNPNAEVGRLRAIGKLALPQSAMEPERQLFFSDLSVVQSLLQFELKDTL